MAEFPIVNKLGGREAVFARLRDKGLVATLDALRMWANPKRAVIPGDAARELMLWADEREISYSAADFQLNDESAEVAA